MLKEKAPCKYLSIIMLDSVIKANKKVLSVNTFRRMQIYTRKDKNWELYWWRFSKSDSNSNAETESDIDNDE